MNPSPFNASDMPLFRDSDPPTSKEAAEQAQAMAASHREAVLAGVRRQPGLTYSELAYQIRMDEVEVMRRLNELRRAGLVVKGPELVWSSRGRSVGAGGTVTTRRRGIRGVRYENGRFR